MTATTAGSTGRPAHWRAVTAASIGNALEWFDFVVYGFFAGIIAKLFFPAASDTTSLLLAFATFGVTFFVRPLGAVVIGSYADRHGRKAALSLTILMMVIGTAVIVVTPSFASIGWFAPLLIVMARMVQGFSAGAEFGSATAFLAEQNPTQRGFYSSWQFASQGMTTILATVFGVLLTTNLTPAQMESWGWRVPFLFGLLIGPVGYYIRRHLEETSEFTTLKVSEAPLTEALSHSKLRLLVSFGVVVLCNATMYMVLFMPTYASRQLGLPGSNGFMASLLTGVIQVALIPLVGTFTDRNGRLPIAFVSATAILLAIYPMFAWLVASPTLQTLLIVQAVIGVLLAGYMGGLAALMSELFPTRLRTTGLSVSYAFSAAIFGGFAPFISASLIDITGNKSAPSFYIIFAALISLTALTAARRLGVR
jgi:MHS family proline/betaine transporter-like MFS transporter